MKYSKTAFCILSLAFTAAMANAGGLADKAAWAKVDSNMPKATDQVKKKCGGDIKFTIDKASFNTPEAIKHAGICFDFPRYFADMCEGKYKDMKADVLKAVTSINCKWDPAVKYETDKGNKFEKSGTNITASFNDKTANNQEFFRKFLEKEL